VSDQTPTPLHLWKHCQLYNNIDWSTHVRKWDAARVRLEIWNFSPCGYGSAEKAPKRFRLFSSSGNGRKFVNRVSVLLARQITHNTPGKFKGHLTVSIPPSALPPFLKLLKDISFTLLCWQVFLIPVLAWAAICSWPTSSTDLKAIMGRGVVGEARIGGSLDNRGTLTRLKNWSLQLHSRWVFDKRNMQT